MDLLTFAPALLSVLSPYLVKAGEKMAEEVGKSLPQHAANLWQALRRKFETKPAAAESLTDLLRSPEDADTQAAFRKEVRKAAEQDPAWLQTMVELLQKAQREGEQSLKQQGNGNVAVNIGGNVQGNIVIGNDNRIQG